MEPFVIDPAQWLTLPDLRSYLQHRPAVILSPASEERIERCRAYLDQTLAGEHAPIYGINTGFGALCNTVIEDDKLGELQRNLLLSHACGMGEEVDADIVRLMLLLKIKGLSHGHSGVQLQTVRRLAELLDRDMLPVVFRQGSLGASGDLAPLSNLALPLIGEGEVRYRGVRMPAAEALKKEGLEPLTLRSKEGLALINGTQFMSAYLSWIALRAHYLSDCALHIAALSADAFDARMEPFDELTHAIRHHAGQRHVAKEMQRILNGSAIAGGTKEHVQDPYSFRCIPQVHGASYDTLGYVTGVLEREINAVTDNPIIFPDEGKVISGGNFHGQPLALVLDFAAIAIAEIASMSERRSYKLLSGQRGLPPFLAPDPGLNSGYMIPQYAAASIVSQNKQLCTPASVDTIDSSNGQEDHVSMGANAATKCAQVVENLQSVLAIEWMTAAQALDFRRPLRSSAVIEHWHARLRKVVPFAEQDISMAQFLPKARALMDGFATA